MDEKNALEFSQALSALTDLDVPFPPQYLRAFSDLSRHNLRELTSVWKSLPATRKVNLLEDLDDLAEHDTLVNFDELAKSILVDEEPAVRVLAIRLLWECEETRIVPSLIDLFRGDANEDVRAAAASLLGKFVLLGELEAIPDAIRISVVNNLIDSVDGEERPLVKQRALESLGYSSHPLVPTMIRKAFESNEISWITSSLCAMGRSADESWANLVESKLDSPDMEVQFEAIRAAGELELATSREKLIDLLDEEIENDDNRLAAIWALSQIGGEEVKDKLETLLEKAGDEEEAEWIEKALENLEFSSSMDMDMLDLSRDHNEADINFDDSMLGEDDEEDDEDSEDIDDEDDFDEDE